MQSGEHAGAGDIHLRGIRKIADYKQSCGSRFDSFPNDLANVIDVEIEQRGFHAKDHDARQLSLSGDVRGRKNAACPECGRGMPRADRAAAASSIRSDAMAARERPSECRRAARQPAPPSQS